MKQILLPLLAGLSTLHAADAPAGKFNVLLNVCDHPYKWTNRAANPEFAARLESFRQQPTQQWRAGGPKALPAGINNRENVMKVNDTNVARKLVDYPKAEGSKKP